MSSRVRWENEVPVNGDSSEITNGHEEEQLPAKVRKSIIASKRKLSPVPDFISTAIRKLSGALDHHPSSNALDPEVSLNEKHHDKNASVQEEEASFNPPNRTFRHLDSATEDEGDPLLQSKLIDQNEKPQQAEVIKTEKNKRSLHVDIPPRQMTTSPSSVSFSHQDSVGGFSTNSDTIKSTMPPYARGKRVSAVESMIAHSKVWKQHGKLSTFDTLSCIYGILLVVMGAAFPISQIISNSIPSHYYEGFYAYLYFVAIGLFMYVYILLKTQINWHIFIYRWHKAVTYVRSKIGQEINAEDENDGPRQTMNDIIENRLRVTLNKELDPTRSANHGSFYLRMGAVVFGVGAMIYSALEFGQYFEMSHNPLCDDVMLAVQPFSRMLFTFFQMYFVFLNAKLQFIRSSNVIIARFGLMHLVATNLCVWLNVIVQETRHEIMHFTSHDHHGDNHAAIVDGHHGTLHKSINDSSHRDQSIHIDHAAHKRSLSDECQRTDLMGTLTQNASPFLFPCAIEYSLICAAIMYEIWKHSDHVEADETQHSSVESLPTGSRTPRTPGSNRRSPHHYSVDCTNANKGLFFGIFVLVMTIVSMILFFVLINREEYRRMAITEIHLSELILYVLTLSAVLIGTVQVSQLHFDASKKLDLDNTLLVVALTGVVSYNVFTIIATHFSEHEDRLLVLINAVTAIVQATAQTIFVIGASKRHLYTRRQQQKKPGREAITFLMVTNFAMWAIITLEKSRVEAHPVQNDFYGLWPWAIISNISSPLSIFYRYHSTVCMCEIWKRCYKVQDKPMTSSPTSPHKFSI